MSLMLLTSSISLQKVLKNGLNVYKIAKLCIFLWLFVPMATRRLNLLSVLFLNHEIQELFFKYDDERYMYLYQSTKVVKIDLKTENCKILLFSFGCVLIVAMATICLNLQSVSLLGHNIHCYIPYKHLL